jgi:hypothetical protein
LELTLIQVSDQIKESLDYFSALVREYPRETTDMTKKEIKALTTITSSIYLFTSSSFLVPTLLPQDDILDVL